MSIFHNDYAELRQQNIDRIVKLKSDNYRILDRMMNYIMGHHASMFELEVIEKDLIGLAEQADAADTSIIDMLGTPEQEFCDSILDGAVKKSIADILISIIRSAILCLFLLTIIDFGFSGFPKQFGITLDSLFFSIILGGVDYTIGGKVQGRLGYSGIKARTRVKWIYSVVGVAIMVIYLFIPKDFLFLINGWILILLLGVTTLIIVLGNNYYWNYQSRKYNWK